MIAFPVFANYKVDISRVRQIMFANRTEGEWWWIECQLCFKRQVFTEFRDLAIFRNRGLGRKWCGYCYGEKSLLGSFPERIR